MDPKSLAGRLGEVQVIDVREPFEWQAGRIEGSRHIPLNELPGRLGEIDSDRPAVAVCFGGARSAYASQFLESQGFEALNLEGGLKSWVSQGLPLSAADGAHGRLVHDPPASGTLASAGEVEARNVASVSDEPTPGPATQQGGQTSSASNADDPGDLSPEMEALKDTFIEVVFAAQERFGDEEPSEEEMRLFMKEWLVSKGSTPDEAEDILNR